MAETILLVDDDDAVRGHMASLLRTAGYTVAEAESAYQALRVVLQTRPDLAVIDMVLPDHTGIDTARAIHAISSRDQVPVVAISGHTDARTLFEPRSFGAECLLVKPVGDEELLAAVARCLAAGRRAVTPPG